MDLRTLLVPRNVPVTLTTCSVSEADSRICVQLTTTPPAVPCPLCATLSSRVHSRYQRTVADLPCADRRVVYHLTVRKFFCPTPSCPRRIFTERVPTLLAPWARRTLRLAQIQQRLGLALGGSAGTQLATYLKMPAGRDLLLVLVRQCMLPAVAPPAILGVDDWALRKGRTYGTILLDLEQRRPIDLISERSAEAFTAWLTRHPGVTIISRDRAQSYAEGGRAGAPDAIHVADRWHLLKNLGEAVLQILQGYSTAITAQITKLMTPAPPKPEGDPSDVAAPQPVPAATLTRAQQHQAQRREARETQYRTIHDLHAAGWSLRAIARQLNLERKTVRKYLRATHCPHPAARTSRSGLLDAYRGYLRKRWDGGCRNAALLYREIQRQGYAGKESMVKQVVTQLRKAHGLPPRSRDPHPLPAPTSSLKPPSPRTLTWWILRVPGTITPAQAQVIAGIQDINADLAATIALAQEFARMVRERQPDAFDGWLSAVQRSASMTLRTFAKSLLQDEQAVRNALTLPWSNGPVEGHIHRLKLLKRQMYGRAKLDLLRLRFLIR